MKGSIMRRQAEPEVRPPITTIEVVGWQSDQDSVRIMPQTDINISTDLTINHSDHCA